MPVSPVRILVANSYLDNREKDCIQGTYPRSHLWGVDSLEKKGFKTTFLPSGNGSRLARFGLSFVQATGGRFGNLGQELLALQQLRRCDVLYDINNNFFFLRLLRRMGLLKTKLIIWQNTPIQPAPSWKLRNFANSTILLDGTDGILCLTKRTRDSFRSQASRPLVEHLAWGADARMFQPQGWGGQYYLCVGRTNRDFPTLLAAAHRVSVPILMVAPRPALPTGAIPENVTFIQGSPDGLTDKGISYPQLLRYYQGAKAVLISRLENPTDTSGYTNLLEAMAMGKPVLMTQTGCLDIDVEAEGIGLHIAPRDIEGWVRSLSFLESHPREAENMGRQARKRVEEYFNLDRFGQELVAFFQAVLWHNRI